MNDVGWTMRTGDHGNQSKINPYPGDEDARGMRGEPSTPTASPLCLLLLHLLAAHINIFQQFVLSNKVQISIFSTECLAAARGKASFFFFFFYNTFLSFVYLSLFTASFPSSSSRISMRKPRCHCRALTKPLIQLAQLREIAGLAETKGHGSARNAHNLSDRA